MAANLTSLHILETVRRHYLEDYRGILTAGLIPLDGELPLPSGPGLGVELVPSVLERSDAMIERLGL